MKSTRKQPFSHGAGLQAIGLVEIAYKKGISLRFWVDPAGYATSCQSLERTIELMVNYKR